MRCAPRSPSRASVRILGASGKAGGAGQQLDDRDGNNLVLAGDMSTRRACSAPWTPKAVEQPELREFANEPTRMRNATAPS